MNLPHWAVNLDIKMHMFLCLRIVRHYSSCPLSKVQSGSCWSRRSVRHRWWSHVLSSPKFAIVSTEYATQLCQALVAVSTAVSLAFLRSKVYLHGPSRSLNLQLYSRYPDIATYSRLSTSTNLAYIYSSRKNLIQSGISNINPRAPKKRCACIWFDYLADHWPEVLPVRFSLILYLIAELALYAAPSSVYFSCKRKDSLFTKHAFLLILV